MAQERHSVRPLGFSDARTRLWVGAFAIAFILLGALFWRLFSSHYLYNKPDGLYSASNVWGDLPVHMALGTSFAERGVAKTLSDNPIYSGVSVSYPFLPDLLSGLLMKAGASPRAAFLWPTYLGTLAFILALWFVALKLTRSRIGALLAPFVFMFNGSVWGLGYFVRDLARSGQGIGEFLSHLGRNYSYIKEADVVVSNLISDFILPQRAFIFGLVLALFALYFLWRYATGFDRRHLLFAALVTGALPLIHSHSFIAVAIISSGFFLGEAAAAFKHTDRFDALVGKWLFYFAVPVAALAIPQILLVLPGSGKDAAMHFGFFGGGNALVFWLKNAALYLPIFLAAYLCAPRSARALFRPFILLFIIASAVIFQPYAWDNTKFIVVAFLGFSILSSWLFERLWQKGWRGRIAIAALVFSMTATGAITVIRELGPGSRLFSRDGIAMAEFIKADTPPDSIFLTGMNSNNPVFALAGRSVVQGYGGWIWSYGIDGSDRKRDMGAIYAGAASSSALIDRYGIDYILIDPAAKEQFKISPAITESYPLVWRKGDYIILSAHGLR